MAVGRWAPETAALVLAAALAGCSPGSGRPAGPPATDARVGLVEWQVTTSAGAFAPRVVLTVTNAGTTTHDLRVRGRRVDAHTPRLAPGQSADLEIDLTGERQVELFCTVPGHRSQGMSRRVPVVGPASR